MSPVWEEENILESVVFSWFAHMGLYVTPVGRKEGGTNEKNTCSKTWFFRGLPAGGKGGAYRQFYTKKTFTSEIFLGQKPPTPGAFSDQERFYKYSRMRPGTLMIAKS